MRYSNIFEFLVKLELLMAYWNLSFWNSMKFKSQNCGPLQAQSLGHSSSITKCNKLQHIDLKERKNKSQSIFNVTSCELWHLLYNSFMLWFLHQLPSQQTPTKVWELLELHTFSLSEAGFQKALNWTKIERRVGWGRERETVPKPELVGLKLFFNESPWIGK